MEEDLEKKREKMEDNLGKKWMEDNLKQKWKNQSTKINLIGCDTIVNSPSLHQKWRFQIQIAETMMLLHSVTL